jgi:hypothetical protein
VNKSQHEELPIMSERRTIDLCGDQLRGNVRCILDRGHAGDHQFVSAYVVGPVTWKQRSLLR